MAVIRRIRRRIRRLARRLARRLRGHTYRWPAEGIMCFHCGRRFRSYNRARLHFGRTPRDGGAACAAPAAEVERLRRRVEALERENARLGGVP